jgi:hypothetical protein
MDRYLRPRATYFLSILMLVFAPVTRSQEQTAPGPQSESSAAKAKLNAEEAESGTSEGTEALQKATQNPVASLISVPVQNNSNFGVYPGYRTQDVLNIQPVIPIGISKDWNLLVRWIMPIVYQPVPTHRELPRPASTVWETCFPHFSFHQRNRES